MGPVKASTPTVADLTDAVRWAAVRARDRACDHLFVYAVRTTGVYCRPSCPSRPANRNNVRFFERVEAAEADGFRACKRCRPGDARPLDGRSPHAGDRCGGDGDQPWSTPPGSGRHR